MRISKVWGEIRLKFENDFLSSTLMLHISLGNDNDTLYGRDCRHDTTEKNLNCLLTTANEKYGNYVARWTTPRERRPRTIKVGVENVCNFLPKNL